MVNLCAVPDLATRMSHLRILGDSEHMSGAVVLSWESRAVTWRDRRGRLTMGFSSFAGATPVTPGRRYAGVMVEPSADGRRLTAHLESGGPCIAVADQQPDDRWLVNGRAMSREHAVVVLEAAVTVAAASWLPHGSQHMPPQPASHPGAESGQARPRPLVT